MRKWWKIFTTIAWWKLSSSLVQWEPLLDLNPFCNHKDPSNSEWAIQDSINSHCWVEWKQIIVPDVICTVLSVFAWRNTHNYELFSLTTCSVNNVILIAQVDILWSMVSLLFRPSSTDYKIYVKQGDGQNEENSVGHSEQRFNNIDWWNILSFMNCSIFACSISFIIKVFPITLAFHPRAKRGGETFIPSIDSLFYPKWEIGINFSYSNLTLFLKGIVLAQQSPAFWAELHHI